jgi:hypothetical protein
MGQIQDSITAIEKQISHADIKSALADCGELLAKLKTANTEAGHELHEFRRKFDHQNKEFKEVEYEYMIGVITLEDFRRYEARMVSHLLDILRVLNRHVSDYYFSV